MKTSEKFCQNTIKELKAAIKEHKGREVFAVCALNREGLIAELKIVARGTDKNVPALRAYSETGDVVIHNHPSGNLLPSASDVAIAAQLGDLGIGFYIVNNSVTEVAVIAEPIIVQEIIPLEIAKLKKSLEAGGEFARHYSSYEERPQQIQLLEAVAKAFNEDKILIAEAATGVGKSLAYLLPALNWIKQNKERVVISTTTINLQEQLIEKDIPLVKRLLHTPIEVMLLKGRQHYLCRTRLAEALEEKTLLNDQDEELKAIYEWSLTSKTGCRADLSFYPNDQLWQEICSEADSCLSLYCKYREECFILKLRKEAAKAQLLIVNHHLLFSDLGMRQEAGKYTQTVVLPPFQRLIFDEAHNLERSATSFFSQTLTRYTLRKITRKIYREYKGKKSGLLNVIQKKYQGNQKLTQIPLLLNAINEAGDNLNNLAFYLCTNGKSISLNDIPKDKLIEFLYNPLKMLHNEILNLLNFFDEVLNELDFVEEEENLEMEIRVQLKRLVNCAEFIKKYLSWEENQEYVFWFEISKNQRAEPFVRLVITPLEIAPMLQETLYNNYPTIIFTSATLAIAKNFAFWKKRVGLLNYKLHDVEEIILDSPFPYKERVLLAIPLDAPEPEKSGYQEFLEKFIYEILLITKGRALVLFTSYEQLNLTFRQLTDKLAEAQIAVLKQGSDERSRLFNRFIMDATSVLFATDSFWEGIDSPGETCETVIICRLPFKVPTEPVLKARLESLEKKGENSFFELSLPEAIMRFRQGFGRLMRRKTDRGIVAVLDTRIGKKSYGQFFLQSLPETERVISSSNLVLKKIESFLANLK